MSEDWRGTGGPLVFVVGALALVLFGGGEAPAFVAASVFVCWVALGVRTGWWIGTNREVDATVFALLHRLRFVKDVRDSVTAAQSDHPLQQPPERRS